MLAMCTCVYMHAPVHTSLHTYTHRYVLHVFAFFICNAKTHTCTLLLVCLWLLCPCAQMCVYAHTCTHIHAYMTHTPTYIPFNVCNVVHIAVLNFIYL